MPWNGVTTAVAGTIYTAARYNSETKENFEHLRQGGIAMTGQADGLFVRASSSTQLEPVGAGIIKLIAESFG